MTVEEQVLQIVDNFVGGKCKCRPGDKLEELELDSLDRVELVMELEDEFDIQIPDHVIDKLVTVQDVITSVKAKL